MNIVKAQATVDEFLQSFAKLEQATMPNISESFENNINENQSQHLKKLSLDFAAVNKGINGSVFKDKEELDEFTYALETMSEALMNMVNKLANSTGLGPKNKAAAAKLYAAVKATHGKVNDTVYKFEKSNPSD
jgi:hypothetical protein